MQVEFQYFKRNDNYGSKISCYAIPTNLESFEIVKEIDVVENDNNALSIRGEPASLVGEKFYLIYQWDRFYKRWEGRRACFSFIHNLVVEGEEMADLSLLITEGIPKLEIEMPE